EKVEEDKEHTFKVRKWSALWSKINAKAGTFIEKGGILSGKLEADGVDGLDLLHCKDEYNGVRFLGHGDCKPGNLCNTPINCSNTATSTPTRLVLTGSSKSLVATLYFDDAVSTSCAEGAELFYHWFYSNPKPLPKPFTVKLQLTHTSHSG